MRDAHLSGKFNAGTWPEMLDLLRDHTRIAGITEAREVDVEGWERDGRHEADVLWRDWEPLDEGVLKLHTGPWMRGSREMHSVDLHWKLLAHPEDRWKLLRPVGHFPAHLYNPSQHRAHTAAVGQVSGLLAELAKKVRADETTMSADFNMELNLSRNRRPLERHGFRVVAPHAATHGIRTIDGFLTTMRGTADVLPRMSGFDHKAVTARLFRNEKENR